MWNAQNLRCNCDFIPAIVVGKHTADCVIKWYSSMAILWKRWDTIASERTHMYGNISHSVLDIARFFLLFNINRKGNEQIRCWANCVTSTFDPAHDTDHGFSWSNVEIAIRNERADWYGMKGMWPMRCSLWLELCPHPWSKTLTPPSR